MILFTKQEGPLTAQFSYSPFFEMLCSLHVLTKPEHHMERLAWAAEMKAKMSKTLYEELMYFGTHYDEWMGAMELSDVSDNINDLNVVAVLDAIASMDFDAFMEILYNRKAFGRLSETPENLRRRFIACLKAYYFQHFESELRYIEPLLIRILKKQAAICDEIGIKEYIKTLHNRIEVTEEQLIFHKYKTFTFPIENIKRITVKISSFINPHLLIGIDDPTHIQLTFRALLEEPVQGVPVDLFKTMKALGDNTRLKILKTIRQKQSTTQSLALDLNLTEACISKHLKILNEADLLYKHRKGNYMYYLLNHIQLDRIPLDIYQYLDAGA